MSRPKPSRPINTAPRDGTVVEVKHGFPQEVVRAFLWSRTIAGVRDDNETFKTLHQVTYWRPAVKAEQAGLH